MIRRGSDLRQARRGRNPIPTQREDKRMRDFTQDPKTAPASGSEPPPQDHALDEVLEEGLQESFPASDPIAATRRE